jgi:hypothetical protein
VSTNGGASPAHRGLGHVCRATGDPGQARHHWQRSMTLYTSPGAPEAGQLRLAIQNPG